MNFFRKLASPVALVTQGFFAGAMLFAALHPAMLGHDAAQSDARAAATVRSLIG